MSSQTDGWGWEEDPPDEDIVRARTKLGQLRVWRLPRTALPQISGKDFAGRSSHPGLYVLIDEKTSDVYVGESGDLNERLTKHDKHPEKEEMKDWSSAIVIGDGRSYYQSMFSDTNLRLYLEKAAIFKTKEGGHYTPINKIKEEPNMPVASLTVAQRLEEELQFVLSKLGMAKTIFRAKASDSLIRADVLRQVMRKKGYPVSEIKRDQLIVNDEPFFNRPGTKPRKTERGWHITLRSKPRDILQQEKGGLIISRGVGYIIPADALKAWLAENLWPIDAKHEAIDVYADLDNELLYFQTEYQTLDLKKFRLTD